MKEKAFKRIAIARTDSIGDVMLTLPMCGAIKSNYPDCKIVFIGSNYTKPIVDCCVHVDEFLDWSAVKTKSPNEQINILSNLKLSAIVHVFPVKELVWVAKRASIPMRIATAGRWFTLSKCNYPVIFSRKKSTLHESQLNFKLLKPLGISEIPELAELQKLYGFVAPSLKSESNLPGLNKNKVNLIIHPLSKGSAIEWGVDNFQKLCSLLPENVFDIFVTGTVEEGKTIKKKFQFGQSNVFDLTGKLTLQELIVFINQCDALVAASTGPLHIAAALNKFALGLYSPKRPIHPGRWAPIGSRAHAIAATEHPQKNQLDISPDEVLAKLLSFAAEKAGRN